MHPSGKFSGLYYIHITIVNYDSSTVDELGASLIDDARVIIYDHHMFIVQATGTPNLTLPGLFVKIARKTTKGQTH